MSMLAERKRKTKWIINPTKKPIWTTDSSGIKFGKELMEKMGWSAGKGLGANEQGIQEPLKVSYKNDTKGMGFKGNEDLWIEHQDEFNELLDNLRNNSSTDGSDEQKKEIKSLEEKSKKSRARVHYQKFTRGKDLSRYSENDLACILGTNKSNKKKSNTEEVIEPEVKSDNTFETSFGVTTINSGSIQDYFKKKWIFNKKSNKDTDENIDEIIPNEECNNSDNFNVRNEVNIAKKRQHESFEEEKSSEVEDYGSEKRKKRKRDSKESDLRDDNGVDGKVEEHVCDSVKKKHKHKKKIEEGEEERKLSKFDEEDLEVVECNDFESPKVVDDESVIEFSKKKKKKKDKKEREIESSEKKDKKQKQIEDNIVDLSPCPNELCDNQNIEIIDLDSDVKCSKRKKDKKKHNEDFLEEQNNEIVELKDRSKKKKRKEIEDSLSCSDQKCEVVESNNEEIIAVDLEVESKRKKSKKKKREKSDEINQSHIDQNGDELSLEIATTEKKDKKKKKHEDSDMNEDTLLGDSERKKSKKEKELKSENSQDVISIDCQAEEEKTLELKKKSKKNKCKDKEKSKSDGSNLNEEIPVVTTSVKQAEEAVGELVENKEKSHNKKNNKNVSKEELEEDLDKHKLDYLNEKTADKFYPGKYTNARIQRLLCWVNISDFKGSNLESVTGYGRLLKCENKQR